jgi:hypothetical protein
VAPSSGCAWLLAAGDGPMPSTRCATTDGRGVPTITPLCGKVVRGGCLRVLSGAGDALRQLESGGPAGWEAGWKEGRCLLLVGGRLGVGDKECYVLWLVVSAVIVLLKAWS